MARIRVSVVTPSLNQARFLDRTIRSVLSQTGSFDLEYVVIDGGSTDGSVDIIRRYESRLVWLSEPDNGQSDAINKGLKRSTGDIVGWVNSDDILLPGALQRVTRVFAEHPQVEWVHGMGLLIDEWDRPIRRWITAYKDWCCRRYSYERLLTECFITQQTVYWRRALLEEIGYLKVDEHLAMDYDLFLRMARKADPYYIAERLGCFRWHSASKSATSVCRHFRDIVRVAQEHAPSHRWLNLCNRVKSARTVGIYTLLGITRGLWSMGADDRGPLLVDGDRPRVTC